MHDQLSYPTLKQVWSLQLSVVVVVVVVRASGAYTVHIYPQISVSLCASILHHDVTFQNVIKN